MRIVSIFSFLLLFSSAASAIQVDEYVMFGMEEGQDYSYVVEESGETVTFRIENTERNRGQSEDPFTVFYSNITGNSRTTTGYDDLGGTLAAYADTTAVIENKGINYTYLINCGNNAYGELPKNAVIIEKEAGSDDHPALPTSSENHDFCQRLNGEPDALSSKGIQEVDVSNSDAKIYLDTDDIYASEDIKGDYRIDLERPVRDTEVELDTSSPEYRSNDLRIEGFQKPIDIGIGETESIADDLFITREGYHTFNLYYREGKSDKKYLDRNLMYCGLNVNDCEGAELSTLQTEDNGPIEVKYERIHEDVTEYASGTEEVNEQRVEVSVEGEKIFEIQDNQDCENMFETAERSGYTFVVSRDLCDNVRKEVGWSRDRGTKYNELNKARVTVLPEDPGRAGFGTSTNLDEVEVFEGIETGYGNFYVAQIKLNAVEIYDEEDNQYLSLGEGEGLQIGDNEESNVFLRVESVDETVSFDIQEERKPDAELNFNSETYYPGSEGEISYELNVDGSYVLKIRKDGDVIRESSLERNSGDQEFSIEEGGSSLEAEVIAPGNLWNPLDNDRTVAEASAEVRSQSSDPIELTNVESANNPLPYAYAIRNPRVVGNQRVDYGMSDWNIGLGGKIRNKGFNEIDLNPNITANGVNLNEADYANGYSTNPNINRFSLDSGEAKKVRMTTDAESLASNIGNGQIRFKLEVKDKEIDLGTIKVSNSSYLINSFESSSQPERGEAIQVSFNGRADGDIIGGEISSPTVVVGTEDREKVIGTLSQSNPQGSNRFNVSGEISIPDRVSKNLVAVAVEGENPESKFKQGTGNEIKILSGTSNLGQSDESSKEDESGSSEDEGGRDPGNEGSRIDSSRISLDSKTANMGESVGVQVSVPDSRAESGYRIKIKGTDRETSILNRQESSWSPEIQQTGDYTVQVVPATDEGLLSGIVNAVTDPLTSKSFEVVTNQPKWITYCSNQEYNMESIEQKASCIEEEIIPEYFEGSTGSNPGVAESLCQDLLGYSYSGEENSCMP